MSSTISERDNELKYIRGHWKTKKSEDKLLQTVLPYFERFHWNIDPGLLSEGTASGSIVECRNRW